MVQSLHIEGWAPKEKIQVLSPSELNKCTETVLPKLGLTLNF